MGDRDSVREESVIDENGNGGAENIVAASKRARIREVKVRYGHHIGPSEVFLDEGLC